MTKTTKCPMCGKEFAPRHRQITCSSECSRKRGNLKCREYWVKHRDIRILQKRKYRIEKRDILKEDGHRRYLANRDHIRIMHRQQAVRRAERKAALELSMGIRKLKGLFAMTTELVAPIQPPTKEIEKYVTEYDSMSDEDIVTSLADCAKITMEQLLRASAIIYVAASRGKDLRPVLVGFLRVAAQVAYGQVTPEAALEFGTRPSILNNLSRLPLHEQKQLMKRGSVEVAVLTDGKPDTRCVELKNVTPEIARQVFDVSGLVPVNEQLAKLQARKPAETTRVPGLPPGVKIDKRKDVVMFGEIVVSTSQLIAIVAIMAKR